MSDTWRLANSLERLRAEVNLNAPHRNKQSDGTIGDENHEDTSSDHNPWVDDGVVTALDITHDPHNGCDCSKLAEELKVSADERLKYVIWDSQIWNPSISQEWRPYTGTNPHDAHVHISVLPEVDLYDSWADWEAVPRVDWTPDSNAPKVAPKLQKGSLSPEVGHVWGALQMDELGFGEILEAAVKAFQKKHGLVSDGVVGSQTRKELGL